MVNSDIVVFCVSAVGHRVHHCVTLSYLFRSVTVFTFSCRPSPCKSQCVCTVDSFCIGVLFSAPSDRGPLFGGLTFPQCVAFGPCDFHAQLPTMLPFHPGLPPPPPSTPPSLHPTATSPSLRSLLPMNLCCFFPQSPWPLYSSFFDGGSRVRFIIF